MIEINVPITSNDFLLFKKIINKGIDTRLEGFTKSKFYKIKQRYHLEFDNSEIQILVRRLFEENTFEAEMWIDNIIMYQYNIRET